MSGTYWPLFFVTFLLFIVGKKKLDQKDEEFFCSIGHTHVIFQFLWIIKKISWTMNPRDPHCQNWYISIYTAPNTLFSPNLLIIITGTFRNTSNPLKLFEITHFPKVHLLIILFMKVLSSRYGDLSTAHELQMCAMGSIFIIENCNFQTLFPTP